jgi:hypothetical protein
MYRHYGYTKAYAVKQHTMGVIGAACLLASILGVWFIWGVLLVSHAK